MKQVIIKSGSMVVDDIPSPLLDENGVLVEVAYSLISTGTELSSINQSGQSLIGKALKQPEKIKKLVNHFQEQGLEKTIAKVQEKAGESFPIGYSCSGVVIDVGEKINDLHPGQRVACAGAGIANHAEIVLVPRNLVAHIPENCGLREAASVTLGSIAMQGVRRADPRLGEIVAVIGLGLIGQITSQLLKAAGCRVIGFDIDKNRLALAQQLGMDKGLLIKDVDVLNEIRHLTNGHGVDSTIITAASESDTIVQQAMEITRKKGRVVVVGAVGLGLKRSPFYEKELDFLISTSYGPGRYDEQYERYSVDYPYAYVRWTENRNMQEYLHLVAENKVDVNAIVNQEYNIDEATKAYEHLMSTVEKPLGIFLSYEIKEPGKKLSTKVIFREPKIEGKINVAVIGAGNFAKSMHLPNLQKLSDIYHIRAVVDIQGSNAKATAERYNADYASTNYEDVLNDETVDMVMICTRHNLHASMAIKAARAGKAIFLEKPMAINEEELNEMIAVMQETQVPFMVGYNRRFSPAARRAKEVLANRQNPLMILYRMNAGYLPPEHWTQTSEGGGRIIGEACHIFDLFQYLTDAEVAGVNATPLSPKTDNILATDNVSITIQYKDGSVATLLYTSLGSSGLSKEYMEIYSDGKVLTMDDYKVLKVYGSSIKGWSAGVDKGHLDELRLFGGNINILGDMKIMTLDDLAETAKVSFIAAKGT